MAHDRELKKKLRHRCPYHKKGGWRGILHECHYYIMAQPHMKLGIADCVLNNPCPVNLLYAVANAEKLRGQ